MFFFFQAEDGIRDLTVTGVQTCALPISSKSMPDTRSILESAGMAGLELPIFELPLVLLPGEQVPLHIFEDRYKRMIGTSLEEGEPLGVVLRDDEGARSVGRTARIDAATERFDRGRMNNLVRGAAA